MRRVKAAVKDEAIAEARAELAAAGGSPAPGTVAAETMAEPEIRAIGPSPTPVDRLDGHQTPAKKPTGRPQSRRRAILWSLPSL